jgi:biopolymer transport protein ExbD
VVAEYTADRRLTVNKRDIPINDLEGFLRTTYETRREKTLFVIGAASVRYGEIMRIIDAAVGAGVTKVGIVTDGMRLEAVGAR